MKTWIMASAVCTLAVAASAQAQTAYQWPATEAATSVGQRFNLPAGTSVRLLTRTSVSTKLNKPGDRINLEVAENVYFRGQVIIPAGAPASGVVGQLQRNGHLGKKGKLEIRLDELQTPSGPVQLSGTAYDEGKSGTALSVGTILFVSMIGGYFIHGTSAEIPAGSSVQAYLAAPLRFTWNRQSIGAQAYLKSLEPSIAFSDTRPNQ